MSLTLKPSEVGGQATDEDDEMHSNKRQKRWEPRVILCLARFAGTVPFVL